MRKLPLPSPPFGPSPGPSPQSPAHHSFSFVRRAEGHLALQRGSHGAPHHVLSPHLLHLLLSRPSPPFETLAVPSSLSLSCAATLPSFFLFSISYRDRERWAISLLPCISGAGEGAPSSPEAAPRRPRLPPRTDQARTSPARRPRPLFPDAGGAPLSRFAASGRGRARSTTSRPSP